VAVEIRKTIPGFFADRINVVYWSQMGYLISVPLKESMKNKEDFDIDGLVFQFCTDSMVYYRNDRTRGKILDCNILF